MYSDDWAGKYPTDLSQLTPNYLKTLPECNIADTVTYEIKTGSDLPSNTGGFQNYYFVYCSGKHHEKTGARENYPRYDAVYGLIPR